MHLLERGSKQAMQQDFCPFVGAGGLGMLSSRPVSLCDKYSAGQGLDLEI